LRLYAHYPLATDRVANVFDCITNFSPGFAEAFFNFTACVVGSTLSLEVVVIESSAESFFCFAFGLIPFSFNFIPVW
jgi:hypothetical protein